MLNNISKLISMTDRQLAITETRLEALTNYLHKSPPLDEGRLEDALDTLMEIIVLIESLRKLQAHLRQYRFNHLRDES